MGCLGLHFSLDDDQVAALKELPGDERVDYVQEEFEERLWSRHKSRAQETDKAWDAIHRALTDGDLAWENGEYPLNRVILGGELLSEEDDYILSLKTPKEVRDVAAAISEVTKARLRKGYDAIDAGEVDFAPSDEDFEYTWTWFESLAAFYRRAAKAGRWVLFTADQ